MPWLPKGGTSGTICNHSPLQLLWYFFSFLLIFFLPFIF